MLLGCDMRMEKAGTAEDRQTSAHHHSSVQQSGTHTLVSTAGGPSPQSPACLRYKDLNAGDLSPAVPLIHDTANSLFALH